MTFNHHTTVVSCSLLKTLLLEDKQCLSRRDFQLSQGHKCYDIPNIFSCVFSSKTEVLNLILKLDISGTMNDIIQSDRKISKGHQLATTTLDLILQRK